MIEIRAPYRPDAQTVAAAVVTKQGSTNVWYRSTHPLGLEPEAWLSVALPVAMKAGEPLVSEAPVSAKWHAGQQHIQQILASWYPELRVVPVTAAVVERPRSSARVASFFSGGVDSFSTVLRNRPKLSALWVVRGFDITLQDTSGWTRTLEHITAAADDLGMPLVAIETNLRDVANLAGDWGRVTNGAALASVALLHQQTFGAVLVPASHSYRDLFPWGSHPLLDPSWSTEAIDLIHEGADLTRFQKTAEVAASPIALNHLRVCWQNTDQYNCGRCEKCVRTQTALALNGASETPTFATRISPSLVRTVWLQDENAASFAREMVDHGPGDHPLMPALRDLLWRYQCRALGRAVAPSLKQTTARRVWWWLTSRHGS